MDKKKLAAAISAVMTYIKTSEEAAAFNAAQGLELDGMGGAQAGQTGVLSNLWGISGRQAHMQSNTMMQMRMFK